MDYEKRDFGKFGTTFQEKLAQLILEDRPFSEQIEEVMELDFFEKKYLKIFTKLIFDYRDEYGVHPSKETVQTLIKTKLTDETEVDKKLVIDFFARTEKREKIKEVDFVKDTALKFCKRQKMKIAFIKGAQELNKETVEYDEIRNFIIESLNLGADNDYGHDFLKDFEMRYDENPRFPVSTGWEIIDDIMQGGHGRGELGVVIAPTGCHAKGTEVLMYNGEKKKVEDVKRGHKLLGPDGEPRTVQHLCRGRDKMYRIIPKKGKPFVVNSQHVLSLKRTKTTNEYENKNDGSIVNITVEEYLEKSKWFKHIHKLYRPETIDFKEIEEQYLPISPYFLGLMLGDGSCCNGNAAFCTMDDVLKESVQSYCKTIGITVREYDKRGNKAKNYNLVSLSNGENEIHRRMKQLGLYGKTSGDKFIPTNYKIASVEQRKSIVAGLIDTDGHKSGNNGYDYVSKSKSLAEDLAYIVRSLGNAAYITEKYVNNVKYYRVSLSGDFSDYPIKVERKKSGLRQQKKSVNVTGFSVEELEEDDYYGFNLDKDHLYMLDDFTVTHNSGKSMAMTHFGAQALLQGKNVVHYTLELSEEVVGQRYDSCISGVHLNNLKKKKDEVYDKIKDIEGNLTIKYYPPKSATVNTFRKHLDKLVRRGTEIDMIIVDYGDLVRPSKARNAKRMELEEIYEELRALASEMKCPLWTASQTNRSGLNNDVVTMESISEAFSKCFVADFIMSLSRTVDDKPVNGGRVYVAKNRNGGDGFVYPIFMDTGYVAIDVLEAQGNTTEEIVANSKVQQEKLKKEKMQKVYKMHKSKHK